MSLQAFWSLFQLHPAQVINALALFFAAAGSWLLIATRVREQRAVATLAGQPAMAEMDEPASLQDERTQRLNRFFYRFAAATLSAAVLLSWFSTRF